MIYFVDLEASSLMKGSFPIEIAWVDQDGIGESHLIRPAPEWLNPPTGDFEWSPASQDVHGISLKTLMGEGEPHEAVALRVAQVLARRSVMACSDCPPADVFWLEMLLRAGGIQRKATLVDVNHIYALACRPLSDLMPLVDGPTWDEADRRVRAVAQDIVCSALEAEKARPRVRHRALPDAESHWRTWTAVTENVARFIAQERAP